MNDFWIGFVEGAKETPLAFFAPAILLWRLLLVGTEKIVNGESGQTIRRD